MAGIALLTGALIAIIFGNPYSGATRRWTPRLLQIAIVGLGAGMDLHVIARVGRAGLGDTAISIAACLAVGLILRVWLKVPRNTGLLVAVGTAICGGSAIAAVAPVIGAEPDETSVALATVFMLNAAALFIFPAIGHALALDQSQFGMWAALAIHDTSSVVGAAMPYGPRALEVATTVKLVRALWIIPLTLVVSLFAARAPLKRPKPPWFIAGFVLAAALFTYVPALAEAGRIICLAARGLMVATLFLIGTGLTVDALRRIGMRPFAQGIILWVIVAAASLAAIESRWL